MPELIEALQSLVVVACGPRHAGAVARAWMKLLLMPAIFMNVFVLPRGLGSAASGLPGAVWPHGPWRPHASLVLRLGSTMEAYHGGGVRRPARIPRQRSLPDER